MTGNPAATRLSGRYNCRYKPSTTRYKLGLYLRRKRERLVGMKTRHRSRPALPVLILCEERRVWNTTIVLIIIINYCRGRSVSSGGRFSQTPWSAVCFFSKSKTFFLKWRGETRKSLDTPTLLIFLKSNGNSKNIKINQKQKEYQKNEEKP